MRGCSCGDHEKILMKSLLEHWLTGQISTNVLLYIRCPRVSKSIGDLATKSKPAQGSLMFTIACNAVRMCHMPISDQQASCLLAAELVEAHHAASTMLSYLDGTLYSRRVYRIRPVRR